MTDFEDEYMDVLQNIEAAIVRVYHEEPGLLDFEVDKVLGELIREYHAEQEGRSVTKPSFNQRVEHLYHSVKAMCDWRLGREALETTDNEAAISPEPINTDDLNLCLKRIRKSVSTWTKQGGRQGYLNYVSNFIP